MSFLRTILLFCVVAIFLWAGGYALFVYSILRSDISEPERETDAIVVLTGGNNRVNTGFDLFAAGLAPKLFISGVNNDVSLDELVSTWPGLENGSRSLPACCMELGYEARSTIENAQEAHDWVLANDVHSIRLVTSPYHMPRALLEFKALMPGLDIITHPVMKDRPSLSSRFFLNISFVEYHKTIYRSSRLRVRG